MFQKFTNNWYIIFFIFAGIIGFLFQNKIEWTYIMIAFLLIGVYPVFKTIIKDYLEEKGAALIEAIIHKETEEIKKTTLSAIEKKMKEDVAQEKLDLEGKISELESGLQSQINNISSKINNSSNEEIVIVPIRSNSDWHQKNLIYFCQKDRFFRENTKYIGFYTDKKCVGYWRFDNTTDDVIKKQTGEYLGTYNEDENIYRNQEEMDYYKLTPVDDIKNKQWKNRAFVRRQQYISITEFNKLPDAYI